MAWMISALTRRRGRCWSASTAISRNKKSGPVQRTGLQLKLRQRRGATPNQGHDRRRQEQYDRDKEDHFRNLDRGSGNTAETENSRDQRNDEKSDGPAKHGKISHPTAPRSAFLLKTVGLG